METEREKTKKKMLKELKWGILLSLCIVVLIPATLKSFSFNDSRIFRTIASNCYEGFSYIRNSWDYCPVFCLKNGFGMSDMLFLIVALCSLFGVFNLMSFWHDLQRYEKIRRQAQDKKLRNDFMDD